MPLPNYRLLEMARSRIINPSPPGALEPLNPSPPGALEPQNDSLLALAKNVHVCKKMTCASFLECLDGLDVAIASTGAGLVVVDSIASLVRKEFDVSTGRGVVERTSLLLKQSARLRYGGADTLS